MKPYSRTDRVADLLAREVATLIQRNNHDLCREVTVTHLQVSPDLSRAKVFVTVLDDSKIAEVLEVLNKEAIPLQKILFKTIKLRRVPQLHFFYDESLIHGQKLYNFIDKVVHEEK